MKKSKFFWLGGMLSVSVAGFFQDILGRDWCMAHWTSSRWSGPLETILIVYVLRRLYRAHKSFAGYES